MQRLLRGNATRRIAESPSENCNAIDVQGAVSGVRDLYSIVPHLRLASRRFGANGRWRDALHRAAPLRFNPRGSGS